MRKIAQAASMMPALAVAAALFAPAFPAAAQENWRPSSRNGEQQAYIDTSSIRRDGDLVRFVREIRMGGVRQLPDGPRYDTLGSLMEVDCRARTLRNLRVYVKLGGEVVAQGEGQSSVEPVQPGTTADTDLRAGCFNEWPR